MYLLLSTSHYRTIDRLHKGRYYTFCRESAVSMILFGQLISTISFNKQKTEK